VETETNLLLRVPLPLNNLCRTF